MKGKGGACAALVAAALLCTGCWDRTEINDIALVMASSLDLTADGRYEGTTQIAIPARQIGNIPQRAKKYFSVSGKGYNIHQLIQDEQPKLSRRLFVGHRRVLLIGEKLARHGLGDVIEYYGRNPQTRLRVYVLVVKGRQGKEALKVDYPLEFVPTEAVREMENLTGGMLTTMRDLLNASSAEGVQPVTGVIELTPIGGEDKGEQGSEETFKLTGSAVFNGLKLAGYLNAGQTQLQQWVTGKLKRAIFTVELPDQQGNAAIVLTAAKRTIVPKVVNGMPRFSIRLQGKGTVDENNSRLDFSNPKHVRTVQRLLERSLRRDTEKLIAEVQQKYGADVFGLGEALHRKDNRSWSRYKNNWNTWFERADIKVDAEFTVTRSGLTGPPLQLREKEIVK
ncbi:Ger(x)C family spore germination protein [Cohnella sp. CFH 77786]|uniref:Ger(x)C family spore germination protein n=1 Tax=Cohnella sp. CFH 77786 TaxID=2662265 RepID=UPI001C61100E|nr:Ger(x)C family spore germination protein [Cohnella sp. CFH 77786]MBW5445675.1 Ger(x)C family spore germination protein [Cohnella sp. CFH 77786]